MRIKAPKPAPHTHMNGFGPTPLATKMLRPLFKRAVEGEHPRCPASMPGDVASW